MREMQEEIRQRAKGYLTGNRHPWMWKKGVSALLACAVVVCNVSTSILPASTVEKTPHCGKEEHIHGEECYTRVTGLDCTQESLGLHQHTDACLDENGTYRCGYADFVVHKHDENCFDAQGNLWCGLPEIEAHTHTDDCYREQEEGSSERMLVCGKEEILLHEHTDDCFDGNGALICGKTQVTEHQHNLSCFVTGEEETSENTGTGTDTETGAAAETEINAGTETDAVTEEAADGGTKTDTEPEATEATGAAADAGTEKAMETVTGTEEYATSASDSLTCTIPEGDGAHFHNESCYNEKRQLACGIEESTGHKHGDRCYGTWKLTCGMEEHRHTLECFSDPTADMETADAWESALPSKLPENWSEAVLSVAKSQLGYQESADNYTVDEEGVPNGYTRYGAWAGDPYGDWDALFVSFCLHYAGVPEEAFPQGSSASGWSEELKKEERGLYREKDGYVPKAGDLVFFDMDEDHSADHVGLMAELSEADGTKDAGLRVIEGDSDHCVQYVTYKGDDSRILGYGELPGNPDLPEQETASLEQEEFSHTLTYTGEDFTVTVSYNADAKIPENAGLSVRELTGEEYEESCEKAKEAMAVEELSFARFFDVSFLADGEEIEPAAPVKVEIRYDDPLEVEEDQVKNAVHFKEDGTEVLDAELEQKDGGTAFAFTQDSFSVVGTAVAAAAAERAASGIFTDTVSPASSVINVFDYWYPIPSGSIFIPDDESRFPASDAKNNNTGGINANHTLKFHSTDYTGTGTCNIYYQDGAQQEIVNPILQNGYPALSGDASIVNGSTESLDYLFDPDYTGTETSYRKAFKGVQGLLYLKDGYYTYNSAEHYAYLNEDDRGSYATEEGNQFTLYNDWAVSNNGNNGQFFPFNDFPANKNIGPGGLSHYFGLTLTARFIQEHGGHTNDTKTTPVMFEFSGDDDVWIFIDDVLVADIGGIHGKIKTEINFATGVVSISKVHTYSPYETQYKTIREMFQKAEREGDESSWNGNTFADNTVHTLKFYYMERGNNESNMSLRYNLAEIPETTIQKVDQYGAPVEGAKFAIYAADTAYNMLTNINGSLVNEPENPVYAENGDFTDKNNTTVKALYVGTTDAEGKLTFLDADGMPYSLYQLRDMYGPNFILREIGVPDGYRVVSQDTHLQIWDEGIKPILKCDNTVESGSRAASTLQVTATDTLSLRRDYMNIPGNRTVTYRDGSKINGTLFAVVFKYNGPVEANGSVTIANINNSNYWYPVSGDDKNGYTMEAGTGLANALSAAKKSANQNSNIIFSPSPNGSMQLTMEHLPGHIMQYYRMLDENNKQNARYTVGYYWTDQSSLNAATEDNTYRVYTYGNEAGEEGSAFDRVFGANIQVPDLINRVLVQKLDAQGNFVSNAKFAIYAVEQDTNGTIRYKAKDGSLVELPEGAVPDSERGIINVNGQQIEPVATDTTTNRVGFETETADFKNLTDGQYIVKEIDAPEGFLLNTTDVMVLVTEDTIYGNAGTADDGVTVGRGPGYLVSPLLQFASEGQIDNTLTWIYARMRISEPSTSFSDATAANESWKYLTENNTGNTNSDSTEATLCYLRYADKTESGITAFNYLPNEERTVETGAQNPSNSRRLFTTVGWNQYEILQDYDYGSVKAKASGANYEDWRFDSDGNAQNLMNLFSRSTYIRVTDRRKNALSIKKVSASDPNTALSDAQFRLYRLNESGSREYYRWEDDRSADGVVKWISDAADAFVVTTGENGLSEQEFILLPDGTYYLEEIKAPDGYVVLGRPIELTLDEKEEASLSAGDVALGHSVTQNGTVDDTTKRLTYTLTAVNSLFYELPSTGGPGTTLYTIGGLLLLAAAGILLLYNSQTSRGKSRDI